MEIQIHFTMQKYNLQKNPLRETKILQGYHNSITNLKLSTQAKKTSSFNQKILVQKLTYYYYYYHLGAKISLSYYILYNESKHNILLAFVSRQGQQKQAQEHNLYECGLTKY